MEDFSKDSRFKKIHTRINGSGEIEGLFKHDTIVKTIVASRCIYGIELNAYLGAKALSNSSTKAVQIFSFSI